MTWGEGLKSNPKEQGKRINHHPNHIDNSVLAALSVVILALIALFIGYFAVTTYQDRYAMEQMAKQAEKEMQVAQDALKAQKIRRAQRERE